MNHRELEAIRARDVAVTRVPHTDAATDRRALLTELDRKWRLLETADAKINSVRRELGAIEDFVAHGGVLCLQGKLLLDNLRKIVGAR